MKPTEPKRPIEKSEKEVEVRVVTPGVYEYRERYNSRRLRPSDLHAPPSKVQLPPNDGLDAMNYKGDKLFFGSGSEPEI